MALQVLLYSVDAPDQVLHGLKAIDLDSLSERQLLWLDLCEPLGDEREQVARLLGCDVSRLGDPDSSPQRPSLANYGSHFRVTATAVSLEHSQSPLGVHRLVLLAGPNYVVTVHEQAMGFLDQLRDREKGESGIGALTSESFAASLLDRLLDTYFGAVEILVRDIDRVEVTILGKKVPPQFLRLLVASRRRVAELRRLLVAHRDIFYGMTRPDFMATEREGIRAHFEALDRRYERAEDEVENVRELVVGSFELLSTRAAQAMNETMRTLTFVTVLMGTLALVAGVMGMNFQMPFFETGMRGFLVVVGIMLLLSLVSTWVAIRRRWL